MTAPPPIDPRRFRDVAGCFATGITVVTTRDARGPRGMTANAVASLSLEPTLFLVCIDRRAGSHEAMRRAGRFAVNVLAEDQEAVSRFFAGPTDEAAPMGPHAWRASEGGSPLLEDALAWLDCRTRDVLDGGDHAVFVGEVLDCAIQRPEAAPLIFSRGQYRALAPSSGPSP